MDGPVGRGDDAPREATRRRGAVDLPGRVLLAAGRRLIETRHRTQHLVIGSGAGGAVTAAYLAEAGESVLVIEEGQRVEPGELRQFSLDQMRRQYRCSGTTALLGNYLVNYAEGCCLGGSTEVNSGLYHLPDEELLERWTRVHGVADLTTDRLAEVTPDIEETLGIALGGDSADGASLRLRDGAAAVGWSCQEVPRWAHREPGGRTVWHGMSTTFVPRAERAGASFLTGLRAESLTISSHRATGVRATDAEGRGLAIEAGHVWLCCGTIGSAALLRRSGVRLGRGTLSAHPTVKVLARFGESLGPASDVPVHQVKEFAPQITIGGSARTASQLALALSEEWPECRSFLDEPDHVGAYYAAIAPEKARGSVATFPGATDPVPLLWLSREDRALLSSGLRRACHLLLAAGAIELRTGVPGVGSITGPGDLGRIPRILPLSASLMTVHTFSSLPMGEGRGYHPTDSFGKLRAVDGIHVGDASLIPSAPGINPQGLVMALAARNARHFLDRR